MSSIQAAPPAFAVLSMAPCAGPPVPGTIRGVCADIPGVSAIHFDTDRGKIHVLYDGSASVIEQVEHVLRKLGHNIRRHGNRRSSMRQAHTAEEEPA